MYFLFFIFYFFKIILRQPYIFMYLCAHCNPKFWLVKKQVGSGVGLVGICLAHVKASKVLYSKFTLIVRRKAKVFSFYSSIAIWEISKRILFPSLFSNIFLSLVHASLLWALTSMKVFSCMFYNWRNWREIMLIHRSWSECISHLINYNHSMMDCLFWLGARW